MIVEIIEVDGLTILCISDATPEDALVAFFGEIELENEFERQGRMEEEIEFTEFEILE